MSSHLVTMCVESSLARYQLDGSLFPLALLEDQSPIYQALGSYFSDRYSQPILEPIPFNMLDGSEAVHCRILLKNRFWSQAAPSIPYLEYLQRISTSMPKLETTALLALPVYARRLETAWECSLSSGVRPPTGLRLGCNLLHRFTITSVCLASKALGDQYYSNLFCSVVGGISARELHGLELELAARLGWDLQCSREDYAWSWSQLQPFIPAGGTCTE